MTPMNPVSFFLLPWAARAKAGPFAFSLLLGGCVLSTGAGEAAAQGTAAATSAKVSGKEYTLTRTSSFTTTDTNARNPFWPIGWVPGPASEAQRPTVVYDVKPEDFTLTTTSVDYPPLAIINGKSYAVGDAVPVPSASQEIVKVKKIQDGVVLLDHKGRELRLVSGLGTSKKK